MQVSFSADEIAAIVNPRATRGSTSEKIRAIAALSTARPGDLSFLGNSKYKPQLATTRASLVLLPTDSPAQPSADQLFLLVENPSAALALICARIEQTLWPRPDPGIHRTAVVAPTAVIAPSATIGPLSIIEDGAVIGERTRLQAQVYVGRNARIGEDCWLMPGVHLATECVLHDRVRLQPGVIIGGDGFGYEFVGGRHEKVPQVGDVLIESDVEIGANSTVDRARFGRTLVGQGTKIDNLVQVGHNVTIGRHCLLCGQVGISGSATLEDYVVVGGQAGVAGHITVGKGVKVAGQAAVHNDVQPGMTIKGDWGLPIFVEQRINVLQKRLPELFERLQTLEAALIGSKKSSA